METEEYFKNRIMVDRSKFVKEYTAGQKVDIDEFNNTIASNKENILKNDRDATDFKIYFDFDGEEISVSIYLHYKSIESEEEYKSRMAKKAMIKERAVKSLETLIKANPEDALRIIEELKLKN